MCNILSSIQWFSKNQYFYIFRQHVWVYIAENQKYYQHWNKGISRPKFYATVQLFKSLDALISLPASPSLWLDHTRCVCTNSACAITDTSRCKTLAGHLQGDCLLSVTFPETDKCHWCHLLGLCFSYTKEWHIWLKRK